MKVVIFGCGRTGSTLAIQLASRGHKVTIIEQNPAALRRLGRDHNCEVVIGSGLDDDVLERASIRSSDVFFALTRGDNTNLMAAQIVKLRFKVERVCVKVADPMRSDAYQRMGFFCINPSSLTAGMMRDWLTSEPYEPIDAYNALVKELSL
jgi:trk system potassium uptake protein TrkA